MAKRVTQAEFARMMGVGRSTVCRWVKTGRITIGTDGKLNPDKARAQARLNESDEPHHQARKAQFEEAKRRKQEPPGKTDLKADQIALRMKRAAMEEREAKAAIAQMEREKQAGNLIERDAVDYVLKDFGNTLRGLMESLPDRLSAELAGYRGDVGRIHAAIEDAARELLEEISEHMKRKMESAT